MRFSLAVAAFAASSASASVLTRAVHERRDISHPSWIKLGRVEPTAFLPLRFGLSQGNLHRLEEELLAVSDPDSPNYGKHWSSDDVREFFKPSDATVGAVSNWLEESFEKARIRLSHSKGWIEVNATAAEAERLLNAEYHMFEHANAEGKKHVACDSYSVPAHLRDHIDIITPTVHFDARISPHQHQTRDVQPEVKPVDGAARNIGQPGVTSPKQAGGTLNINSIIDELENCDKFITPNCLRALYKIVYKPIATKKNSYGIVEYTPQAFLQSDLDLFFKNFSKNQVQRTPQTFLIDGAVVQTEDTGFNFNGESDLDLEFAMTLVNPQPVQLYQAGDLVEGASFNNLLDALDGAYCTFEGGDDPTQDGIYPDTEPGGFKGPESCGTVKPANVISTSYAMAEADATPAYLIRQCNEYGKLGLMGTTILYSSGDNGVASFGNVCLNPDGTQSASGKRFNPLFPASCPFVTGVGATQVSPNKTVLDPESACEQVIFSGGGFSNVFARPSYQEAAVTNFLTKFPPPYTSAQFNTSKSRGFPDLSANGANYLVAVAGNFERVFGTSASSPTVGSILTLINDARLAVGKSPIGFINPTIYKPQFARLFNDITNGTNQGCGTVGFSSQPGWDPVTGLGTPNFPKLLAAWLLQ